MYVCMYIHTSIVYTVHVSNTYLRCAYVCTYIFLCCVDTPLTVVLFPAALMCGLLDALSISSLLEDHPFMLRTSV